MEVFEGLREAVGAEGMNRHSVGSGRNYGHSNDLQLASLNEVRKVPKAGNNL